MVMHDADTLIARLNGYPRFSSQLTGQERQDAYEAISALVEAFQAADYHSRCYITHSLNDSALAVMYGFSRDQAAEGRTLRSREAIRTGLLAVVMGGGSPHRAAPGSLAPILLRSAVVCGFD